MPSFSYEVRQRTGQVQRGTMEGESAHAVARTLQAQGYFVVAVRPLRARGKRGRARIYGDVLAPVFYPVGSKSLAVFFTSLRVLLSTGMNVSEATAVLAQRTSNPTLVRAAREMSEAAAQGQPMSSVVGRHPSAFNATTTAILEAGEESGLVEQAADRLAKYYERIFQLEQAYRWQTFYPKVLLIALIVIPTTKTLLFGGFHAWLVEGLWRGLPGLAAIAVLWYGWRALRHGSAFAEAVDRIKLAIPWVGSLARRIATARWARALATLLSAGVPVHRALVAAAAASGNRAMEASLAKEAEGVLEGRTLTEVVAASRAVPAMAVDLLAAAERAGSYEGALEKVADYYESETEVGGKQTAIVVGVTIYLIVAALIAFTVITFYLGYFRGYTKLME